METTAKLRKKTVKDTASQLEVNSSSTDDDDTKDKSPLMTAVVKIIPMLLFIAFVVTPYIYYYLNTDRVMIFARVQENVKGRGQILNCSAEYKQALKQFRGCLPEQCQRFTTDNLVNTIDVETLLNLTKKAVAKKGPYGGATIANLHSGAKSSGKGFLNVQDLKYDDYDEIEYMVYKNVVEKIRHGIGQIFNVDPKRLYPVHPTYVMEVVQWQVGELIENHWHLNFDTLNYDPFLFSTTVFLNDYKRDYSGGRMVFDAAPVRTVLEPRKGRAVLYTTGPENPVYVETVQEGARYSLTVSFACKRSNAI